MDCNRMHQWKKNEHHICFVIDCNASVDTEKNKSCPKCNWKYCNNGHCGCSISKETKLILDKFYDLFCEPKQYKIETKYALNIMLDTFWKNCRKCIY